MSTKDFSVLVFQMFRLRRDKGNVNSIQGAVMSRWGDHIQGQGVSKTKGFRPAPVDE